MAALIGAGFLTVDINGAFIIDRAKVQDQILIRVFFTIFRNGEIFLVPGDLMNCLIVETGGFALIGEGNSNLFIQRSRGTRKISPFRKIGKKTRIRV